MEQKNFDNMGLGDIVRKIVELSLEVYRCNTNPSSYNRKYLSLEEYVSNCRVEQEQLYSELNRRESTFSIW